MSTVDDTLPYMQAWLDARAAQVQPIADFNTARAAVTSARQSIQARVNAGDSAAVMKPLVDTYITARTNYIAADTAQRNATAATAGAAQAFEQACELVSTGQPVPPYVPPPPAADDAPAPPPPAPVPDPETVPEHHDDPPCPPAKKKRA